MGLGENLFVYLVQTEASQPSGKGLTGLKLVLSHKKANVFLMMDLSKKLIILGFYWKSTFSIRVNFES